MNKSSHWLKCPSNTRQLLLQFLSTDPLSKPIKEFRIDINPLHLVIARIQGKEVKKLRQT